jgi:hypothetical protein
MLNPMHEGFDNVSPQNTPSHEEFDEYFQNLSNVTEEDLLQPPDMDNIRVENLNSVSLNIDITVEEVFILNLMYRKLFCEYLCSLVCFFFYCFLLIL